MKDDLGGFSEEDIAVKRLRVLQQAEVLGSVSEACRRSKMDRTSFYEWRKRYQKYGLKGLQDLPPIHKSHPQTTSSEVSEKILNLSKQHPNWGCVRISEYLKEKEGIKVSSPTVQKILIRHGMGRIQDRVLMLEKDAMEGIELSQEQLNLVEKVNSCFKERHNKLQKPGELLIQDTITLGKVAGLGKVYAQTVIDPYSSFAFAILHTKKQVQKSIQIIHQEVIPFYQSKSIPIESVMTDLGTEYTGKNDHPFEIYLNLNGVKHDKDFKSLNKNGFVLNFKNALKEEFLTKLSDISSLEELQQEFTTWLHHYNHERIHTGFPTMGKSPYAVVHKYRYSPQETI